MVKVFSDADREAISSAIAEAEKRTEAEIAVIVASASDSYAGHVMLTGLMAGSVVGFVLWAAHIVVSFPLLLAVQFGVMAVFLFVPFLQGVCARFVPISLRRRRAAHRAYEEYMGLLERVSGTTPVVLLYISVTERYAHILTSREVREKLPKEQWQNLIQELTSVVTKEGLREACVKVIRHAADLLALHFPEKGRPTTPLSDDVIEIRAT